MAYYTDMYRDIPLAFLSKFMLNLFKIIVCISYKIVQQQFVRWRNLRFSSVAFRQKVVHQKLSKWVDFSQVCATKWKRQYRVILAHPVWCGIRKWNNYITTERVTKNFNNTWKFLFCFKWDSNRPMHCYQPRAHNHNAVKHSVTSLKFGHC